MDEVAAGVTDLLLGSALLLCAAWLVRTPRVHRYWPLMFWSASASALIGAAHHLLFAHSRWASNLSWIAVGVLIAVAISYMLAATATELLTPRVARLVIRLRVAGLVAYLIGLAVAGLGSRTTPLVIGESATMAAVVGLWLYAVHTNHPGAPRMLLAIAVMALPAIFFALPAHILTDTIGLDARALQHLGEIPGLILLTRAVSTRTSATVHEAGADPTHVAPAVNDTV